MKRLCAVAILLLALPAVAQIRGVPASVTSQGHFRSSTPGIPASVTSLGPNGYGTRDFSSGFNNNAITMCSTPGALIPAAMGCTDVSFTNQLYGQPVNAPPVNTRTRSGHRRGHNGGAYYPVYVPYAVPVAVEEEPAPSAEVDESADEPPALTVFERRSKSAVVPAAPAIDESRVYRAAPNQAVAEPSPEHAAPAIVLIYKDGHQRELQNYAIMGNYIYDIGTFVAQKIALADLNLKATVKANDERGVEFSLPAGVTP